MVRTMFGKLSASAVVALALCAWSSPANAFWHHHRGWGGGSSGGSSGGGWGGSSGGWGGGSSGGGSWGGGGWHGRHHGGWRWGGSGGGFGGSSGGMGSSGGGYMGGSSGGWGSSGGSSGGGGVYYSPGYGAPAYGTPAYGPGIEMTPVDPSLPPAAVPPVGAPAAPLPALPAPGTSTSTTRADGLLAVSVPEDARIFVNGQPTTSTGSTRQYVSRDLRPGFNYSYEVRAEIERDGRLMEHVKKVDIRAGETARVAFDFPVSESIETSLTLHVPAEAKVFLAGNATKAGGETRIFRTTGLSGSKGWDDYTVRVEIERGGRTMVKEETISLKAGQSQELRFEFDGDKIAAR
jgi:uncharacterized protein (TIGR03000 family)